MKSAEHLSFELSQELALQTRAVCPFKKLESTSDEEDGEDEQKNAPCRGDSHKLQNLK